MKKTVCALLAAIMTLGLFAGCGEVDEKQFNAYDLAIALQVSGLEMKNIIVYTEETDTNHLLGRPNQYTSKVNFADTRLEQPEDKTDPAGGIIEVFKNAKDAKPPVG